MTANSIDMKHIYEKGLEPVDFIKYTLPLDDNDCEELISLSIGAELLPQKFLPPREGLYR